MTFSDLTTATSGNGGQYSARGARIDRIILHHCASTSLGGVLGMMASGSREVSANYVTGNSGEIVGVVPEEYRAWTSGSTSWDGRAITFEIVNESGGPDWRISDKAFDAVARMLADISVRYGIPLNRDTVITHQELYTRYGASYATACPGPYLQARIDNLIAAALTKEDDMTPEQAGQLKAVYDALFTTAPTSRGTRGGVLKTLKAIDDGTFKNDETSFGTPGGTLKTLAVVLDQQALIMKHLGIEPVPEEDARD